MSDKPAPCYRDRDNGVYFTRNAHRPDCADGNCRGCRPCPEPRHCTAAKNCSWHVAEGELTCGRCIAGARRNLRWIASLASLLLPQALADGVDSEAANLAGPAADPEAWTWRKVTARRGGAWHVSLIEDDDEHHPHTVTGTWARMLAEDYVHDMPPAAPLSWCVDYLDRTLHRVAHDPEQDFPLLGRELRKCRQHLEAVLHNDDRPDRGAPCPECTSEEAGVGPRLVRHYGHWCEDPDCEKMHYSVLLDTDTMVQVPDTAGDEWVCPRNREHRWTHKAYSDYVEERKKARTA